MNKINTNCKHIFRYEDVLDKHTCEEICNLLLSLKGNHECDLSVGMPWDANDTLLFENIENKDLKHKIINYRQKVKNLVMLSFNSIAYIEFTHLVVWRKGKEQLRHKDDGYGELQSDLKPRKFTTVTYLNDTFNGGETFISTEHGYDYINKPKAGSVVLYRSDERCEHGVNKVLNGIRLTLPIWFCTDYWVSEENRIGL